MPARSGPRSARASAPINAANLKRAHALIESGRAKGKIVLEGFGEHSP